MPSLPRKSPSYLPPPKSLENLGTTDINRPYTNADMEKVYLLLAQLSPELNTCFSSMAYYSQMLSGQASSVLAAYPLNRPMLPLGRLEQPHPESGLAPVASPGRGPFLFCHCLLSGKIIPMATIESQPQLRLATPMNQLAGVTQRRSESLARLGIETVRDLIRHMPMRYEQQYAESAIGDLPMGRIGSARGMVIETRSVPTFQKRSKPRFEATVEDLHNKRQER